MSDTIVTSGLNEYFGFIQTDMEKLLKDFQMETYADTIKEGMTVISLEIVMCIVHGM